MPLILPPPETQFLDGNGHPFAGGTVTCYVPGTDTPKDTFQDHEGTILNTNPVVLNADGRAIILGSGDYRLVLRDQDGNLIYDQWTSSVISDAMQPVVRAATIAEARDLLGITDEIQAETDRATAAEADLSNRINAETTRAEAAEANLQAEIDGMGGGTGILPAGYSFRFGTLNSGSDGSFTGTFSPPFPNACDSIVTTCGQHVWAGVLTVTAGSFTGLTSSPLFGGTWGAGPFQVWWQAIGH